tara:strand:- start:1220 stop:1363 length:144 start_codon:yes stop_codon:yes gene_type:complete
VLTTFTVTETYEVTAATVDQVQKAISEDDFSEVETDLERKITIEPNF